MPDISQVHHDIALTNVSIAYRNSAYIAGEIAREVPVRKQSNRYFVYDPGRDSMRATTDDRAPGSHAREVDFDLSSDTYFASDHALEAVIPDEERDNSDSPLQPLTDRVEFLTDKILLNQEYNLATMLLTDANIPGTDISNAANRWDDDAVDPVDLIETARASVVAGTQQMPNTLVLPFDVYQAVRNNPNITQRIAYSRLGVFGPSELAQLFDVERILVPRSVRNGSAQGQTPSLEPVWGKNAFMLYVPQRAGLKTIAPVLNFNWVQGAGINGTTVQNWRDEGRKSTLVRVQKYYDQKVVAPQAAYIISNAIS